MVSPKPGLQRWVGQHNINPVELLALCRDAGGARGPHIHPSGESERGYHIKVAQDLVEVPTDERWYRSQCLRRC